MLIEYIGMIVCFIGILGLVFFKPEKPGLTSYDPESRTTGIIISFTLSWVFAFVVCFNRRLKNVHFLVILFYHSIFGMTCSIAFIISEKMITGIEFRWWSITGS